MSSKHRDSHRDSSDKAVSLFHQGHCHRSHCPLHPKLCAMPWSKAIYLVTSCELFDTTASSVKWSSCANSVALAGSMGPRLAHRLTVCDGSMENPLVVTSFRYVGYLCWCYARGSANDAVHLSRNPCQIWLKTIPDCLAKLIFRANSARFESC